MNPRRLFQALNEESVDVILIGGVAMVAHGISYNTNDIDLCYKRDRDNMERLTRAIVPFNPRMRVENLTDAEAQALPFQFDVRSLWNIESLTLMTDIGPLDLLTRISGIGGYDEVRRRAIEIDFYDMRITILSLTGLIENKRASARHKDIRVLPLIEATLRLQEAMAERASHHNDVANQQVEGDAGRPR